MEWRISGDTTKPAWLPDAAYVGALDGVAEASLDGTEELFAALEEERDRRGITQSYQIVESGYNIRDLLRGYHKTFDEDDWAFLRRYITCSLSKKSAAQLKVDYEEANKDKKPDWAKCGVAKKSEVVERALKQYVASDVDVYALSGKSPELAAIADLFENCSPHRVRLFINDNVNLLSIAGAKPRSLEIKLQAARDARGDEPKVEYRGLILDAVGAVLKVGDGDDDDFDAARKAKTLRERVGEFSSVVEVRRAAVKQELEEFAARLRAEEESCSEKARPSLAEVAADVRALAVETAVELSVEARPQFAARRLEGGVWSAWDPCGTKVDVQKSLKVSERVVRGLLGTAPLSRENKHLANLYEVKPYDEAEHGPYEAAQVAARFDDGSAFSAVEAALASEEEESSRAASLIASSSAAAGRLPPLNTRRASASVNDANAIGETARPWEPTSPTPTSRQQVASESPALATLATDFRGALDKDNAGKPSRKAQRCLASSGGVSRGTPTTRPSPAKPRTRPEDPLMEDATDANEEMRPLPRSFAVRCSSAASNQSSSGDEGDAGPPSPQSQPRRRLHRAARAVQEARHADALRVESLLKHVHEIGAEPVVEEGWEPAFVEALDEASGNVAAATYLLWKGDHIKASPHEYG